MILTVKVLLDATLAAITCSSTLSLCSYFIQSTTTIWVSRRRNNTPKGVCNFFLQLLEFKKLIFTQMANKHTNLLYIDGKKTSLNIPN